MGRSGAEPRAFEQARAVRRRRGRGRFRHRGVGSRGTVQDGAQSAPRSRWRGRRGRMVELCASASDQRSARRPRSQRQRGQCAKTCEGIRAIRAGRRADGEVFFAGPRPAARGPREFRPVPRPYHDPRIVADTPQSAPAAGVRQPAEQGRKDGGPGPGFWRRRSGHGRGGDQHGFAHAVNLGQAVAGDAETSPSRHCRWVRRRGNFRIRGS